MNTKKTLADAKHGGCVQLGDGLLPCPFCGNGAEFVPYKNNGLTLKCKSMGCIQRHQRTLRYGVEWLRTSMTEHWNARALSAQPSRGDMANPISTCPGGQGEALLQEVCAQLESLDCGACIGSDAPMEDLHGRIAAHLAARQPVGEPVAVEVPQGAIINGAAFADRLERAYQFECPAGPLVNCTDYVEFRRCFDYLAQWASNLPPLYAAPPAQAGDLGAVRALLQRRIEQWRSHLPVDPSAPGTREIETNGEHDYNNDVRIYREGIAVMEEVLSKIDSDAKAQAVDLGAEPMFYIQDTRQFVGNCPMWWGPNGRGYVTRLNEAGRYTEQEAIKQNRTRDTDIPWPCAEIDAIARHTVDFQHMRPRAERLAELTLIDNHSEVSRG